MGHQTVKNSTQNNPKFQARPPTCIKHDDVLSPLQHNGGLRSVDRGLLPAGAKDGHAQGSRVGQDELLGKRKWARVDSEGSENRSSA